MAEALEGFRFTSPYGPDIRKWLKQGIGLHHAGLLPKYRVLVEQLAQRGLLKVICGTDTLGVGINVPIRTVLFTRLCKFDGQKTAVLSARDFHQIAGRAGRKGFDDRGFVVAQAPEHVIENLKLDEKAKDGKKVVKRKPPEHNFANWDLQTFKRLIGAPPERLTSRFDVSHGMLLNVLSRRGDGCRAMQALIRDSHETDRAKKAHFRRGWQLFRALVDRGIVEITPRTEDGSRVRVNVDLQDDFSMNQALSLYLLETIPLLDAGVGDARARPAHARRDHPREPGADPAPAARQAEGPEGRGDEGGGARLRPAHGGAGEAGAPEAAARLRLHDVQRLRRPPPVGGRGEHPAEVDRARDVRGLPLLLRLRAGVRPRARRGPAAPPSQQRVQGPEPDRARRASRPTPCARWSSTCATCCARSTPACSTSGSGCATRTTSRAAPARRDAPAAAGGAAGRHPRRQGLHRRHPHARLRLPARLVDRRRRSRALGLLDSPADADGEPWTAARLRAAREAYRVEHSAASASTPRPATSATPTSSPPTTGPPGACSRCSWTPRA